MTRAASATKTPAAPPRTADPIAISSDSELPLYSLVFLLPAIVLFEIGAGFHPSDPIAFRILQEMFEPFGAKGRFIPALCLVSVLLSWHIVRKDAWQIKFETIWTMTFESLGPVPPVAGAGNRRGEVEYTRASICSPVGMAR